MSIVTVALQADGTQSLALQDYDGRDYVVRESVLGLDTDFVDIRLVIDPSRRITHLQVDGVDCPSV